MQQQKQAYKLFLLCGKDNLNFFQFEILTSYQKLMTESSRMPLFDLRKLNASLPVPPMKDSSLRILVLGAKDDFIVVKFFAFRVHTLDLHSFSFW